MFTGIIEKFGIVRKILKRNGILKLLVEIENLPPKIDVGSSLCINGVCLTVVCKNKNAVEFDVVQETLKKTNLGELKIGEKVNIEEPLTIDGLLGGHLLQGHIDCTATIVRKRHIGENVLMHFKLPPKFSKMLVEKGSIAVDGISLTIVDVKNDTFSVTLIPHTLKKTTLGFKKVGRKVNIEIDYFAKLVYKFVREIKSAN